MTVDLFPAAAVLLFIFGLLRPEKAKWLKWPTGIVGVGGTIFVLLVLWALSVTESLPLLNDKPVGRWLYLLAIAMLELVFWSPAIGLWLGRKFGRFIGKVGRNVQEARL